MYNDTLSNVSVTIMGRPAAADSPPGPVYVSPDMAYEKPEPVATRVQPSDSQVTQTVYGFLDFTTTIGDTVMVFMPQSASAAPGECAKSITRRAATERGIDCVF